jgi:diguanylate cyclase (GGDEF)-like protein/PAS domain S-box-containing protein
MYSQSEAVVAVAETLETRPYDLEVMEQISHLSLQADNIDELLNSVLDVALKTFKCERVYFRQSTPTIHQHPIERVRTNWPGENNSDTYYSLSNSASAYQQLLLESKGKPITAGNGNDIPLSAEAINTFQVKSSMVAAIQADIENCWHFGIHHCQNKHIYSKQERHLFSSICLRLADALNRLITLTNLRVTQERQRLLFENAPDAILVFHKNSGALHTVNRNAESLLATSRDDLLSKTFIELISHADNDIHSTKELTKHINAAVHGVNSCFEWNLINKDGKNISSEIRLVSLPDNNEPLIYASIININQRKTSEAQQNLLSHALEKTADSVMITDTDGNIEFVNTAFEQITGYQREEVKGKTPGLIKSDQHDNAYYQRLWKVISSGNVYNDIIINRRRDGSLYTEEKTITPLFNQRGDITHYISTGKDITDRLEVQERLNFLAHHDALTGLPNRLLFIDRLDHALKRSDRSTHSIAVLFIDLDHFKNINDSSGHDVGDQVLKTAAQRLKDSVRKGDTVARLAGDEFAVILEDISNEQTIPRVADNILHHFSDPFEIGINQFYLSPSIGISLFPTDGEDSKSLLKSADLAMYRAKEQGRNNYQFYADEMRQKALTRHLLESNLRHALERNEFHILYQPQICPQDRKIVSAEALLRWKHPSMGTILPVDFIPVLEETGLIVPVSEWIISSVCTQMKEWRNAGLIDIRVAVNISARQFDHGDLTMVVKDALYDNELPAESLELEVTESMLMRNEVRAREILTEIEALGVSLALDDFGTGFSSLIYLKRFPIHTIKIDRSFVMDIGHDQEDEAIVRGVIGMAKSLNLDIVAEGVEKENQITFLKELDCEMIQGFAISEPISAERMAELFLKQE